MHKTDRKIIDSQKFFQVKGNREQLNEHGGIRRFLHVFEVAYRSGIKEKSIETIALQYLELSRILLVDVLATDRIEKVCFLLLPFIAIFVFYCSPLVARASNKCHGC